MLQPYRSNKRAVGLSMAVVVAIASTPAAAREVSERLAVDLFANAGVLVGSWTEFEPQRPGTAPLPSEAALGISDDVTVDHWALAGRATYRFGERDVGVLQLSHRRFADSTITDAEDALELDWLYYEHRFGASTTVRLGRTPIPFGLMNEQRDLGTDLPFFRVPFAFYNEGGFVTETVDGARLQHRFAPDQEWGLTIDAYGGQWELLEMAGAVNRLAGSVSELATDVVTIDANDGFGWAIWGHAPWGIRLGAGEQRFSSEGGFAARAGGETDWEHDFYSFEIANDSGLLRVEFRESRFPVEFDLTAIGLPVADDPGVGFRGDTLTRGWYATLGRWFTQRWGFFLQREQRGNFYQCFPAEGFPCLPSNDGQTTLLLKPHGERIWVDTGISLNLRIRESLILKAEAHRVDGTALRRDTTNFGFVLTREDPASEGSYGLVSIAWRR